MQGAHLRIVFVDQGYCCGNLTILNGLPQLIALFYRLQCHCRRHPSFFLKCLCSIEISLQETMLYTDLSQRGTCAFGLMELIIRDLATGLEGLASVTR